MVEGMNHHTTQYHTIKFTAPSKRLCLAVVLIQKVCCVATIKIFLHYKNPTNNDELKEYLVEQRLLFLHRVG